MGGTKPVGFSPGGVPEKIVAEAIRVNNPMPGVDHDWEGPFELAKPGINGSTVPLPYQLDPARVPVAGSYVDSGQQESLLTSAWYQLPPDDGNHPLVVVTAAGTIACNSVLNDRTDGQTVEL